MKNTVKRVNFVIKNRNDRDVVIRCDKRSEIGRKAWLSQKSAIAGKKENWY